MIEHIEAGDLRVGYEEHGAGNDHDVVLLHGFPYDTRCYDQVAAILAQNNCRVIVPWLRGYGPTRFLSEQIPRSGQQGVLGNDVLHLLNALQIDAAVLAGYDWGGRAACIVAALWPERCRGLVSGNVPYNIQDIARAGQPGAPETEYRYWYQYYMHTERGRAGVEQNRYEFAKLLWQLWSPKWQFDEATFARSAASFDNPDFVEVVIHSYRHRFGLADGDPKVDDIERQLALQPAISVPTVAMTGDSDGVEGVVTPTSQPQFSGTFEWRIIPGVGHNIPQEAPEDFADAVLSLVN